MRRRLIVCADDFGLDPAVNEAVERASRDGILTCTSLMVGAPAAADAVARARLLPRLKVGLHLVLVEGSPVLPAAEVPALITASGEFDRDMVRAGIRFFCKPSARRQLAAEIRAQFEAFRRTGLALDHVNAHKHFHVHPTLGRLLIDVGRDYGLRAVRVPIEPAAALRRAGADRAGSGFAPWAWLLRRRLKAAGIAVNDQVFGLAWSGGMTEDRLLRLIPELPDGVSEIYSHPATAQSAALARVMPDYRPVEELAALLSPAVRRALLSAEIELVSYGDLADAA